LPCGLFYDCLLPVPDAALFRDVHYRAVGGCAAFTIPSDLYCPLPPACPGYLCCNSYLLFYCSRYRLVLNTPLPPLPVLARCPRFPLPVAACGCCCALPYLPQHTVSGLVNVAGWTLIAGCLVLTGCRFLPVFYPLQLVAVAVRLRLAVHLRRLPRIAPRCRLPFMPVRLPHCCRFAVCLTFTFADPAYAAVALRSVCALRWFFLLFTVWLVLGGLLVGLVLRAVWTGCGRYLLPFAVGGYLVVFVLPSLTFTDF